MRSVQAAVSIMSLSLLTGCSSGDRYGPVVLEDDLACRIEIDSSVVLRWDSTLSEPDFGVRYAVNSRGEILGGSPSQGRVMVWDSLGNPLGAFGAPGEGPGELMPGSMSVHVTPGDTVFVRDNSMRWIIFGPDFKFVRTAMTGPVVGTEASHTAFLPDGSIVGGRVSGSDTSFSMVKVDRSGTILDRIGPPRSYRGLNARPFSPDGQGGYWVGPPPGPTHGYVVEHWTALGEADAEIRRTVPWFRADPSWLERSLRPQIGEYRSSFPFPAVGMVHLDGAGLLWVVSNVPVTPTIAEQYATTTNDEELIAMMGEGLVRVVEVFSPAVDQPIASTVIPFYRFVSFMSNGSHTSWYRLEDDHDGNLKVVVMRFTLSGRTPSDTDVCRF